MAHLSTQNNWLLTTGNTGSATPGEGYNGGQYWDLRIPFEAAIEPEKYLAGLEFFDVEPHPSAALNVTSSWIPQSQDNIYSLMANNFFGEVASFFLKDQHYTRLESGIVTDDLQFETGSTYGARLKIRRSTQGPRTYEFESGSNGGNEAYTNFGGRIYDGTNFGTASFPLPQDPRQNIDFKETFTMYSRPSAFGPPIAGRPSGSHAAALVTLKRIQLMVLLGSIGHILHLTITVNRGLILSSGHNPARHMIWNRYWLKPRSFVGERILASRRPMHPAALRRSEHR